MVFSIENWAWSVYDSIWLMVAVTWKASRSFKQIHLKTFEQSVESIYDREVRVIAGWP